MCYLHVTINFGFISKLTIIFHYGLYRMMFIFLCNVIICSYRYFQVHSILKTFGWNNNFEFAFSIFSLKLHVVDRDILVDITIVSCRPYFCCSCIRNTACALFVFLFILFSSHRLLRSLRSIRFVSFLMAAV